MARLLTEQFYLRMKGTSYIELNDVTSQEYVDWTKTLQKNDDEVMVFRHYFVNKRSFIHAYFQKVCDKCRRTPWNCDRQGKSNCVNSYG